MSRKMHSNQRKPLLLIELKQEVGKHLHLAVSRLYLLFASHRKLVLALMLGCVLASAVLAFTVLRRERKEKVVLSSMIFKSNPAADLLSAGTVLKRVLDLQQSIHVILVKDSLTSKDSLELKARLKELEQIRHQFNLKNKAHEN